MIGRKLLMTAGACVLSLAVARAEQAPQTASPPRGPAASLAALEQQALSRHPAIREAEARLEEARGRATQAGAWMNPTVGITMDELRPRENPSGFVGAFVQQTIPLGGKLAVAATEAELEVVRREAALSAVRQRVISTIRTRFYAMLTAEERVTVTERLAAHADEVIEIARQLFNVGMADQPDVLTAEVGARRVALDLVNARTTAEASWRLLAVAVAEPALPRGSPGPLDTALPDLDRDASLARVLRDNPDLATAMREVERERAAVTVAGRIMRPDLFLRGEAGWNREHLTSSPVRPIGWQFGLEAGFSLPAFNKNSGAITAAGAAVTAAESAVANLRLTLEGRFAVEFADYERARAAVQAYRADILPRAEQAHALYLEKYRQMAAAYPQVLAAQRVLIDLTGEYIEALDRAWRAALRLQGLLVESGMWE